MEEEKLLFILKDFLRNVSAILCISVLILMMIFADGDALAIELNLPDLDSETGNTYKVNYSDEDMEFAQQLSRQASELSKLAVEGKLIELENMQLNEQLDKQNKGAHELKEDGSIWSNTINKSPSGKAFDRNNSSLRVFVSSSMPIKLLKNYIEEAKKYKAILVFNGLPDGSWNQLANLIHELVGAEIENSDVSVQIDDESFALYSVTSVPSFVLKLEGEDLNKSDGTETLPTFDKVVGNIGIRRALESMASEGSLKEISQEWLKAREGALD